MGLLYKLIDEKFKVCRSILLYKDFFIKYGEDLNGEILIVGKQ